MHVVRCGSMNMAKRRHDDDTTEVVRRAIAWFESEDSRKSRDEARTRAAETRELLEQGNKIDSKKLSEPFTV